MKIIFDERKAKGRYPDLTDGKLYEVESREIVDGVDCFFIVDDDESEFAEPYPYPISLFAVAESIGA